MSQILKFSVDGEPWENPGNLGAAWLLGRTCHLLTSFETLFHFVDEIFVLVWLLQFTSGGC